MFGSKRIEELLGALGQLLHESGSEQIRIAVFGGAALNVIGLVSRVTRDIDCLAYVDEDAAGKLTLSTITAFPEKLKRAIERVRNDFGLPEDWINFMPSVMVTTGLPEGIEDRLIRKDYGSELTIYFVTRYDLIHFKLFAAEQGPGRHSNDLLALKPTSEEIRAASEWCLSQDPSEGFRIVLIDLLRKIGFEDVASEI
jgi:hypothetical protein